MTTPLLDLRNVSKVFSSGFFQKHSTTALDNVSFQVKQENPGITAIAGESGSGKTTLARLLLGIVEPTSGKVLYLGKELRSMSKEEQREYRREVQPIFQDPFEVYNPFYRVDHVLTTPIFNFNMADSKEQAADMAEKALETVGLRPIETLGRFPHQLSGGQRQRIMVARALLLRPRVIVADEPVSMVDASLRANILERISAANDDMGISVLYITHDLTTALQISDNIIVLYQGTVVETGKVETVINDPRHPYTQLLVDSIPKPDPKQRWGSDMAPHETGVAATLKGCKFAPRCPFVMEECKVSQPPLYRTGVNRAAACYLEKESAIGNIQSIDEVFVKHKSRTADTHNAEKEEQDVSAYVPIEPNGT